MIDETIERIKNLTITEVVYDPKKAELVIDTKNLSLKDSALLLINFINQRFIVST